MGAPNDELRALARQIVEHETRERNGPLDLAEGIEAAFRRLYDEMLDLVGEVGLQTLMNRAAHLSRSDPTACGFENVTLRFDPELTLAGLAERVDSEPPARVIEGAAILLANVIDLFCTFIGTDLTLHLVRTIWPCVLKEGGK